MALADGEEAFTLTEAFDGVDTEYAAVSIIGDGVPQFYVETVADGQAAWTYDIFFAGPHLANTPQLTVFDEGKGEKVNPQASGRMPSLWPVYHTLAQTILRVLS